MYRTGGYLLIVRYFYVRYPPVRYIMGAQLGPQGQKILNDCHKRKSKKEALVIRNKSKISSASKQKSNQNDLSVQQRILSAAVINGVMQASTSLTDDGTLFSRDSASDRASMTQIGTHATRNTSTVSTRSRPTYYHHRNVVNEWLTSVLFRILFFLSFFVLLYYIISSCLHSDIHPSYLNWYLGWCGFISNYKCSPNMAWK